MIKKIVTLLLLLILAVTFLPVIKITEREYISSGHGRIKEAWAYGQWVEGLFIKEKIAPYDLYVVGDLGSDVQFVVSSSDGKVLKKGSFKKRVSADGSSIYRIGHIKPARHEDLMISCKSAVVGEVSFKLSAVTEVRWRSFVIYHISGV